MEEETEVIKDNKSVRCPSPDVSLHQVGKIHPVSLVKVYKTLYVALPLVASDAI